MTLHESFPYRLFFSGFMSGFFMSGAALCYFTHNDLLWLGLFCGSILMALVGKFITRTEYK